MEEDQSNGGEAEESFQSEMLPSSVRPYRKPSEGSLDSSVFSESLQWTKKGASGSDDDFVSSLRSVVWDNPSTFARESLFDIESSFKEEMDESMRTVTVGSVDDNRPERKQITYATRRIVLPPTERRDPTQQSGHIPKFSVKSFIAISCVVSATIVLAKTLISAGDERHHDNSVKTQSRISTFVSKLMSTEPAPVLDYSTTSHREEDLFRVAQQIVSKCSAKYLDKDLKSCQHLCKNHMCCFDEDERYNCALDIEKDCVAHAGCESLMGIN